MERIFMEKENNNNNNNNDENNNDNDESDESENESILINEEGLGTNLRPNKRKAALIGSNNIEAFLNEVEKILLSKVENYFENNKRIKSRDQKIFKMKKDLKKINKVVIPTDKTNSFKTVEISKYTK